MDFMVFMGGVSPGTKVASLLLQAPEFGLGWSYFFHNFFSRPEGVNCMPQQVTRLAAVLALVVTALIVARYYLVPETFGDLGHYRAASVDSIRQQHKMYAGRQECALCHGDVEAIRAASNHDGVSCEVCHGPAANHVAAPMEVKPPIDRERETCTVCHSFNPSRPTGFAQIDPIAHNPMTPCVSCHLPHAPEPPSIPGACSACHGQIARQKAVSHHAGLACTTCHEAPDAHKEDPRSIRHTRPTERAFCGSCHSEPAMAGSGIPQVELRSHGERYLCWQCHYPHSPESGS